MISTKTKKFHSQFHEIDLKLLRMLCDLHPWSMAELCKTVDMEPSVLSMVLAGKRPLPTRVARQFLELVGMKEDGTLNPSHGFIFKEKLGRQAELREVYERFFSAIEGVCHLTMAVSDLENPTKPPTVKTGFVLFQGSFLAVVHADIDSTSSNWLVKSKRVTARYQDAPEVLLSTIKLPTKVDMLKAFAGSQIQIDPTWEDVIREAKRRNIEPRDAFTWLETHFSVPHHCG